MKTYVHIVIGHDHTGEVAIMEVFSSEESAKKAVLEIWNELAEDDQIRDLADLRNENNVYWMCGGNPCVFIEKKELRK